MVVLSPPAAKKVNAKIDQKLQLHWVNPLLFQISESFFNKRAQFVVINCQMYVLNHATKMVDKSWAKNKHAGMHTKYWIHIGFIFSFQGWKSKTNKKKSKKQKNKSKYTSDWFKSSKTHKQQYASWRRPKWWKYVVVRNTKLKLKKNHRQHSVLKS